VTQPRRIAEAADGSPVGERSVRSAVTRTTYEAIRRAIVSGALPGGVAVSERRLATRLGVSRTPVREALAMLSGEELLVPSDTGQLVVREVSVADIREAYAVRYELEGFAARLAAETRGDRDLERLRAVNESLRQAFEAAKPSDNRAVQTRMDAAFHKGIAAASGNRELARLVALLIDTPVRERAFFWFSGRTGLSVRQHTEIVDALERRDGPGAQRLLQQHIREGGEELAEHLTQLKEAARGEQLWTAVRLDAWPPTPLEVAKNEGDGERKADQTFTREVTRR
jgi:DNA-binding GntR family transcriptional regulator